MRRFSINKIFSFVFLTFLLLLGCTSDSDPRLERIDRLSEKEPRLARAALDSIDPKSLSTPARHFYDLLDIKINDKSFIQHTSDSLIIDVLDYYSAHKNSPRYAEALYYAGRVYSDIGDLPLSLLHYQESLDIYNQSNDFDIKASNVMAQISDVLTNLRLYSEAKQYIKKSIDKSERLSDKRNLVDDLALLGWIYLKNGQRDSAATTFEAVVDIRERGCESQKIDALISLALIEMQRNNIRKALSIIRPLPAKVDSISLNFALANAAYIYKEAGILDTAYIYAYRLVKSENPENKKAGYNVLLSPELMPLIPSDSLYYFFNDYKNVLDMFYDKHESQAAVMQQTKYNYELHVKEKNIALRITDYLKSAIMALAILVLLFCCLTFYLKNKNNKQYIKLMEVLARLSKYEKQFASNNNLKNDGEFNGKQSESNSDNRIEPNQTLAYDNKLSDEEMRNSLRSKLLTMQCTKEEAKKICAPLLEIDCYHVLQDLVEREKSLKDSDPLWKELEKGINLYFPNFRENLKLLSDSSLSKQEFHIAILIKYGLSPVQMSGLLCKVKSGISYHRGKLKMKLFGSNDKKIDIDKLIYLL